MAPRDEQENVGVWSAKRVPIAQIMGSVKGLRLSRREEMTRLLRAPF